MAAKSGRLCTILVAIFISLVTCTIFAGAERCCPGGCCLSGSLKAEMVKEHNINARFQSGEMTISQFHKALSKISYKKWMKTNESK